ncbi:hypothetical protein SEVIR_6G100678v4 [Setaria viridis]
MREEFEVLPEVMASLNEYSVSFCFDSIFQLLEKEGCEHFLTFTCDDYAVPTAMELVAVGVSKNVNIAKLRMFKRLWLASCEEHVKQLARDRLAEDQARQEHEEKEKTKEGKQA